jgi:hypothetical protein
LVAKKNLDRVKEIVEKLQEDRPFEAVTKKRVFGVIKKEYQSKLQEYAIRKKLGKSKKDEQEPKYEVSYRTIERSINILVNKNSARDLVKDARGQYWLPKNYDNFKRKKKAASHILDALRYCDSEEDWKLLEAFFAKMRENEHERDRAEYEEAHQRARDIVLEEVERNGKSSTM